jgi:cellobiose phosphorylase
MKKFRIQSKHELEKIVLHNSQGLSIEFLKDTGALYHIFYNTIQINLLSGNPLEGNIQNIYLRRLTPEEIQYVPVIGPNSRSSVYYTDNTIVWHGSFDEINYTCQCFLHFSQNVWFWNLEIINTGTTRQTVDCIYFQDKGLARQDSIKRNVYYNSHYVDNRSFSTDETGWVLASRQNQVQDSNNPWMLEGGFPSIKGFATDALQFLGTQYKATNHPHLLTEPIFPNRVLQGEFSVSVLQTEAYELAPGESKTLFFFSYFQEHHPEPSSECDLQFIPVIKNLYHEAYTPIPDNMLKKLTINTSLFNTTTFLDTTMLKDQDITKYFGNDLRHKEEKKAVYSFFYDHSHVVLQEKEIHSERPHGHIIKSGNGLESQHDILSATNYMYGCFFSHVALGNSWYNQFISRPQDMFNMLKSSGQRIFVLLEDTYYLLGVPSAYELGFNFARWFYKVNDVEIIVTAWTDLDVPLSYLEIVVEKNTPLSFLLYHEI